MVEFVVMVDERFVVKYTEKHMDTVSGIGYKDRLTKRVTNIQKETGP